MRRQISGTFKISAAPQPMLPPTIARCEDGMASSDDFQVVWPGGAMAVPRQTLAMRPDTLNGRCVAFVWDYVFRGDEIFPILREAIARAFSDVRFVDYDAFGPTFGGDEHQVVARLPALLRELGVDVAISGIGACGACTPAVIRASAAIERAGVPTASLVCEGFIAQARAVSPGLGFAILPVATLPGHVDGQSAEELKQNVLGVTLGEVLSCLTAAGDGAQIAAALAPDYRPWDIVATGSFAKINETFQQRAWSDGLPIVPPTRATVSEFLDMTPDAPDRLIGVIQPSGSAMTVHNVAVNGVMAGCRPQHMPILVAIAEILVDPAYGVEHSGDTTGGDALIILNGPICRDLGFNCENGALRDGSPANSSVGRFLRLLLRNVARSLPGGGDKSTFGHTFRVALAEHELAAAKLGWRPFSVDQGFGADDDVVTIARFTGDTTVGSIYGKDPHVIARYLADGLIRQSGWELIFTAGFAPDTHRPLVVLSPMVAKTLTRAGIGKAELKRLLFEYARIPAWKMETYIGAWTNLVPGQPTLRELVAAGRATRQFALDDNPERLAPIVERPEDILVVVSGDPLRSNACVFGSNGMHGFPTSRRVRRG
jgi:hypothetical protein